MPAMKRTSPGRIWTCTQEAHELLSASENPADFEDTIFCHARTADTVEKAPGGDRRFRFRVSTETKDRHGDVVRSKGATLKNFRKNPVVLFAHESRQPPIGKSPRIELGDGVIDSEVDFFDKETFEFADTIYKIVKAGGLRATSIGFMPLKWGPLEEEDESGKKGFFGGIDFQKWDLLEWSIVPIPANPEAVRLAAGEGASMKSYLEYLDGVQDNWKKDTISGLLKEFGLEEKDFQEVRRAADGGKSSVVVPADVAKALEQEGEGEEEKETVDPSAVIPWEKAHADGTPAQPRVTGWNATKELREADVGALCEMSAWTAKSEDPAKADFRFPHHVAAKGHAVNFRAVASAFAVLLGARGGVELSAESRRGVYDHLAKHLQEDFDLEPPDVRWLDVQPLKSAPDVFYFDHESARLIAKDGDTFVDARDLEKSEDTSEFKAIEGVEERLTIGVVCGRRSLWPSREKFLAWAKEQGFKTDKVEETRNFWKLVQADVQKDAVTRIALKPSDFEHDAQDCAVVAELGIVVEQEAPEAEGKASGDEDEVMLPFAQGDVVSLRSGGPRMTVDSVSRDKVAVQWFDNDILHKESFPIDSLVLSDALSCDRQETKEVDVPSDSDDFQAAMRDVVFESLKKALPAIAEQAKSAVRKAVGVVD